MRDDEGRTLNALDDLCHRVGLARTRGAEQHLSCHAVLDAAGKIGNRLRLIAHRFKRRNDLERDLPLELRCIEFWHHRHASPSFTKSYSFIISYPSRDAKIFPVIFYKRMSLTAAFVQKHIDAKKLKTKKDITASEENYLRGRAK